MSKIKKISEPWGYKGTVEIDYVRNWYGEYLKKKKKGFFRMVDDYWMCLWTGPEVPPFFTTYSFLHFPWLDVSSAYFLVCTFVNLDYHL